MYLETIYIAIACIISARSLAIRQSTLNGPKAREDSPAHSGYNVSMSAIGPYGPADPNVFEVT